MIVHQVFAQIYEGQVKNIIVCDNYEMANYIVRATYGDNAFAVDCLQYPCGIGHLYHDGSFWKINDDTGEEVRILPLPTQEQEVQDLKFENEQLMLAMADVIGGVYNA